MSKNNLLNAALAYAAAGWHVLPCREEGERAKAPYTAHGFKDATTDPEQITQWWEKWPKALIGLRVPDTVVVIDIDPRSMGIAASVPGPARALVAHAMLVEVTGPLPATLTAWSGRGDGGHHLYFRAVDLPEGVSWKAHPITGVDVKAPGKGYVIAPPSPHPATGMAYQWQDVSADIADLPREALYAVTQGHGMGPEATNRPTGGRNQPNPYWGSGQGVEGSQIALEKRRLEGMVTALQQAPQGKRNTLLNYFGYTVWTEFHALDRFECLDAISDAAAEAGLDMEEIRRTITSARTAGERSSK